MAENETESEGKYRSCVETAQEQMKVYKQRSREAKEARRIVADCANRAKEMHVVMKDFAKDIGCEYNTLQLWVKQRDAEIQTKPIKDKFGDNVDKAALERLVNNNVVGNEGEMTDQEMLNQYDLETKKSKEDIIIYNLIAPLKRLQANVHDFVLHKLEDQDALFLINTLTEKINTDISSHFRSGNYEQYTFTDTVQ